MENKDSLCTSSFNAFTDTRQECSSMILWNICRIVLCRIFCPADLFQGNLHSVVIYCQCVFMDPSCAFCKILAECASSLVGKIVEYIPVSDVMVLHVLHNGFSIALFVLTVFSVGFNNSISPWMVCIWGSSWFPPAKFFPPNPIKCFHYCVESLVYT